MDSVFMTLQQRGFIEAATDPGLERHLAEHRVTVYAGFDPTADSLHVGNLLPIMALAHFQRAGHRVLLVVGGATGMVGDPSGRASERSLQTPDQVAYNVACFKRQLVRFLAFDGANPALLLDNNEWIGRMSFIDWLREVGKHFNVNQMLAKESVKARLASETGISYTEFSYMTMQAYDFKYLCEHHDCTLQVGGSDQWGNITAGIDLARKTLGRQLYGITFPLLTTATGEKFGKSAGNAVWLDPGRTSPFRFYQYWINTTDADVERFLTYFSFLELDEVASICQAHGADPARREGQKRLAAEMTKLVHGADGLAKAERATQVLFGGSLDGLSEAELLEIFADVPSTTVPRAELAAGLGVLDLCVRAGLAKSKGEARRLLQGGGVNLNNRRVDDAELVVKPEHLVAGSCLVLRAGKKNYHLVRCG